MNSLLMTFGPKISQSLSEDWGVVLKLVARNPVGKSVDGDGAFQGLQVPK